MLMQPRAHEECQRAESSADHSLSPSRAVPRNHVSDDVMAKIVVALKHHGIEQLPETDEHGARVRWLLPRAQRPRNW
jgi:hypothetical protein